MTTNLINTRLIIEGNEINRTCLDKLKISYKEVRSERNNSVWFQLFFKHDQSYNETLAKLNRWQVQTYLDSLIKK